MTAAARRPDYNPAFVPPHVLVVALLATVVPLALVRLWWIWWQSICGGCGFAHRACECPPDEHVMRPRR